MPHETAQPGSPEVWLRHARSDLRLASITPPSGVLLEALCFHAQQAAEKAIKAVLISLQIPVPKSHSIGMLLDLLPTSLSVPERVERAALLTDYAVMTRYPGDIEPISEKEYKAALDLAQAVVAWAANIFNHKV